MDKETKNIALAAKAGGQVLQKYFGQQLDVQIKTVAADFVTLADTEAEAVIIESLEQNFPDYNIDSEEKGLIDKGSDYTFVIDPLDGSNNFVCGFPNFSIAIALVNKTKLEYGAVYVPLTDQLYWAARGQGAFLGERQLKVSQTTQAKLATVAVGLGYNSIPVRGKIYAQLDQMNCKRVLNGWCSALEHGVMAAGNIDLAMQYKAEACDFLAGKIIMREAGAIITDLEGNEEGNDLNNNFVAAATRELLDEFLAKTNFDF